MTNPANFVGHRRAMVRFSVLVGTLPARAGRSAVGVPGPTPAPGGVAGSGNEVSVGAHGARPPGASKAIGVRVADAGRRPALRAVSGVIV
jgi:hypothetical protein